MIIKEKALEIHKFVFKTHLNILMLQIDDVSIALLHV
jgi:hypothetical protein